MQVKAEVANLDFDEVSNDAQVRGRNAKNDTALTRFFVSARRASRYAGTDVRLKRKAK